MKPSNFHILQHTTDIMYGLGTMAAVEYFFRTNLLKYLVI